MSSKLLEARILDQFKGESTLSDTNVYARVDDDTVVLKESVDTMAQHDLALHIAQNAAGRKIVDGINVKQQT
jgi:hypothetical protein